MANYNVGNIEVGITSNSKNAIKSFDDTIKKLQEFKVIDKNLQNIFLRINQLGNGIKRLANADLTALNGKIDGITKGATELVNKFNGLKVSDDFLKTTTALNRVANAFRQFDQLKNLDFRAMYESFNRINRILTPFLAKLQASEESLKSLASILTDLKAKSITKAENDVIRLRKETEKAEKQAKKTKSSYLSMFNLGKIYLLFNYTRKFNRALASTITMAMDFVETLNKFQVAMGINYERALTFVNKLTYAFNMSTESIMNYQATFKNMLSALGKLGEETSYELSETLTRMALDYASLFNVQVETAMNQFQQVLAGQIRQIRQTAGYDVSENTIFALYKELGGTKTMRQLDQVEKRLLRILAVQKQMTASGAVGDFEKTINTASNQMKQLKETLKEVGMWMGQLTMNYIQPFIEKVLAGAIALREMLKALNIAKGFELPDFGKGGSFEEVKNGAEETEEAIEGTEEATEKLKRSLLGFDKLNILGDKKENQLTPDYSLITNELKKYEDMMGKIQSKAQKQAETLLNWLGYIKEVDEKTGEISWKLKEGFSNLVLIKGILTTIGVTLATISINKLLTKIIGNTSSLIFNFSKINKNLTDFGSISYAILPFVKMQIAQIKALLTPTSLIISIIIGLIAKLYVQNKEFKTFIDQTFSSILGSLGTVVNIIGGSLKPLLSSLLPVINALAIGLGNILTTLIGIVDMAIKLVTFDFSGLAESFKRTSNAVQNIGKGFSPKNFDNSAVKTSSIPAMANGGVVSKPTMALVGEYSGANSNPEIVSPESLMRKVFAESMLPMIQAIVNGDNKVVNAIGGLANRPIELNGRKVSENIFNDLQNVAYSKGMNFFGNN